MLPFQQPAIRVDPRGGRLGASRRGSETDGLTPVAMRHSAHGAGSSRDIERRSADVHRCALRQSCRGRVFNCCSDHSDADLSRPQRQL